MNILKEFCDEDQFRICDLILPPDTFTYLSPSHNSTSWLDHVLCSGDVTVTDIKVLNNLSLFDHFPITVKIDLKSGETLIPENKNHVRQFIDWTKFDEEVYNGKLEELLCSISICDKVGCIFVHRKQMDDCYEQIIRSISEASHDFCMIGRQSLHQFLDGINIVKSDIVKLVLH